MEKRRQPEIIAGRVNADGSIAGGDGFSVAKTGTGVYGITFASGFKFMSVAITPSTSAAAALGQNATERFVQVALSSTVPAFTGVDQAFSFIAVGVQQ